MLDECLKMYSQALQHLPSRTLFYPEPRRALYKRRWRLPMAMRPSFILLHTDENDELRERNQSFASSTSLKSSDAGGSLLGHANTVGIIAGASADAALSFLSKVLELSSKDGRSCLPFVLCSDPSVSKELLAHERGFYLSLTSKDERSSFDHAPVVENLRNKRVFLEKSGAGCIVMPCHKCHSWHHEISKGCSVPFLHVADCVAEELKEAKLKPIAAGGPLRIGLLATNMTLTAGFYQEKLQSQEEEQWHLGFHDMKLLMKEFLKDLRLCFQIKQPWNIL